jgi:hypothetical protein
MASGKLLLRMDHELHEVLQGQASKVDVSLNDLCCERLYLPSPLRILPDEVRAAILAAQKSAGSSLVGVMLFGSWARGQQTDTSDVDLLIVLDADARISRSLYSKWQQHATSVRKCEPHFVVLPQDTKRVSGLWAEIAMDGVVLVDPQLQIQRYLMRIRRALAEGRLFAKKVHGQTYWVQNEVA